MSWTWLGKEVVLAIHDQQIAEHGGLPGLRDKGLLESALDRPVQLAAYGGPDACDLAAAYAWGIARNHPFLDGNKRTAYVCCMLFLRVNGLPLHVKGVESVIVFERLGNGEVNQDVLAHWLRDRLSA